MSACSSQCPLPVANDYGVPYFEVDCTWIDPRTPGRETVWRCFEDVETEVLSGFIFLELENPQSLYLCGTDLVLNTGVTVYDNLIGLLTKDNHNCLHLQEDRNLGNSFDWTWDTQSNTLQFIWRPEDEPHKILTLIIDDAKYDVVIRSTVYYKIISSD